MCTDATTPAIAGLLLIGFALASFVAASGAGRSPWRRALAAIPLTLAPLPLFLGAVFAHAGPSADSGSWTVVAYGWALVAVGVSLVCLAGATLAGGRWAGRCALAVVVGLGAVVFAGASNEFVVIVGSAGSMAVVSVVCSVFAVTGWISRSRSKAAV
jgi:hypothetical protein